MPPVFEVGTEPGNTGSITMEYRGVKYTITQETEFRTWRWLTIVGKPPTLKSGEESSQMQAEVQVKQVIDWALDQAERSKRDPP